MKVYAQVELPGMGPACSQQAKAEILKGAGDETQPLPQGDSWPDPDGGDVC